MDQIRSDQRDAAARTLAVAFYDDPLLKILERDEEKRRKVGPWFMGRAVNYGLRWGHVWGNEDASAVAIWIAPDGGDVTAGRMLRAGMAALPLKVGISQADAAGLPCYLETGTESNVAYYRKRGFEVTGQAEVEGFTLYGMVRPPRERA